MRDTDAAGTGDLGGPVKDRVSIKADRVACFNGVPSQNDGQTACISATGALAQIGVLKGYIVGDRQLDAVGIIHDPILVFDMAAGAVTPAMV